ncbi:MAG: hypothetical protein FWD18_08415 [Micrococcales bacterium]|nr:hypothetical protein [Micrococcales bacterium]
MPETRPRRAARRLLLVGVLALALVTSGAVAWAYWSAQGTATGTAMTSGTLDMTITGADGTLVGPGGTAALPGLALADAVPGSSVSQTFTIQNSGTAPFIPAVTATASAALASWLDTTVLYGATSDGTTCTGGTTTQPSLAAAQSVAVCVVVALDASAPASAQGQSATVTLALTATQVP